MLAVWCFSSLSGAFACVGLGLLFLLLMFWFLAFALMLVFVKVDVGSIPESSFYMLEAHSLKVLFVAVLFLCHGIKRVTIMRNYVFLHVSARHGLISFIILSIASCCSSWTPGTRSRQ